jgi:ribosomal protein S18 acetylase RimI-like enzyme
MNNSPTIFQANLANPQQAQAVVHLLNAYALDPMGGGEPLSCFVQANLVAELQKRTNVLAILAMVGDEPAGLAICVEGFSTFACKPLLNVHDMVVLPQFRGRKLSQHILAKAQELAVQRGCCKLTLEVLQGNTLAQQAYRAFGFEPYQLDAQMGQAQFWQKAL